MCTVPAKMFNQFICSSLMLPEHREALNRHNRELRKQEKECCPYIEEEERDRWDRLLGESLQKGRQLAVTCLEEDGPRLLRGVVCRFEPLRREISMQVAGKVRPIPLDCIVAVQDITNAS